MSNKSCPISFVSVDANAARITAFYVALLFGIYLILNSTALILFLIVDFSARVFLSKEYSPLYLLSMQTQKLLHIESIKVDAAPKKLAAIFGLLFVITIFLLNFFQLTIVFYTFSAILLLCLFLEVTFSYCLGCEIYHLYQRVFV
jgi:hypothetical protein